MNDDYHAEESEFIHKKWILLSYKKLYFNGLL